MNRGETTTIELIMQFRRGDRRACSRLVERQLPSLKRFAQGRFPAWARGACDAQDLVQDVFIRALPRLESWQSDSPGALGAFLRRAVANRIVDELRKARRRSGVPVLLETIPDRTPSPLATIVERETLMQLRSALQQISQSDRRLLAARFVSGWSYAEIAERLRRPNANASRVAVVRAVKRLAREMRRTRGPHGSL